MIVSEVMTSRVLRVQPDASIREALRIMIENRVDGLPVVNDRNEVVGILTYADLLRQGRRQHPVALDLLSFAVVILDDDEAVQERLQRLLQMTVWQVAKRHVITCGPEDDVAEVAGKMVDHGIKRLPVVNEHGHLTGIVSRGDIMRALWRTVTAES